MQTGHLDHETPSPFLTVYAATLSRDNTLQRRPRDAIRTGDFLIAISTGGPATKRICNFTAGENTGSSGNVVSALEMFLKKFMAAGFVDYE